MRYTLTVEVPDLNVVVTDHVETVLSSILSDLHAEVKGITHTATVTLSDEVETLDSLT